jgi:hypothetical protein
MLSIKLPPVKSGVQPRDPTSSIQWLNNIPSDTEVQYLALARLSYVQALRPDGNKKAWLMSNQAKSLLTLPGKSRAYFACLLAVIQSNVQYGA